MGDRRWWMAVCRFRAEQHTVRKAYQAAIIQMQMITSFLRISTTRPDSQNGP